MRNRESEGGNMTAELKPAPEYVPMTHEELWAAWTPGSYNYDALRAFEQAVVRRMRGEA